MAPAELSLDAQRAQLDALRALDVEGRLRVAESLRAFAWELKTSAIAARNPGLPAADIADQVREAFGGGRL